MIYQVIEELPRQRQSLHSTYALHIDKSDVPETSKFEEESHSTQRDASPRSVAENQIRPHPTDEREAVGDREEGGEDASHVGLEHFSSSRDLPHVSFSILARLECSCFLDAHFVALRRHVDPGLVVVQFHPAQQAQHLRRVTSRPQHH